MIDSYKFVGCILHCFGLLFFCFEKLCSVLFDPSKKLFDFWLCYVAHSMRMSHRYFIFSLLQYCMMDRYLQFVSICMDMLDLRLNVVNLLIAFVLFQSFAFEKFMLCMFAF